MAEAKNSHRRGNPWITAAWITVTAVVLLAPLVAMQFTSDVNWTVSDFVFAGGLLVGAGMIYEFAARAGGLAYQAGVVTALAAAILTMWVTGAVGIIGSEHNPGNLLYVGVVAVAIVGSLVARAKSAGMMWAMIIAALAEVLVPAIGYAGLADPRDDVLAPEVFAATAILAGLWLIAAWLFRRASNMHA